MAKRIEFSKEEKKEIQRKFSKAKKLKDIKSYKYVQVLNMRRLGKTRTEISEATGYHAQTISDIVSQYIIKGMESLIGNHYTSHNRRMSFEEESSFLEQFREEAESGLLISVKNILKKYEEVTGKESNTSTIYALLKRHGWRKVKPRPRHPGCASEEEQESSKKLTLNGNKSYWKNISQTVTPNTKKSKAQC
jgi:transposase